VCCERIRITFQIGQECEVTIEKIEKWKKSENSEFRAWSKVFFIEVASCFKGMARPWGAVNKKLSPTFVSLVIAF